MALQTLGKYRILDKLGEGGMGEVYRARDTALDRNVAIKVLPAIFARDADWMARFEREAKSVAQLSHPNILSIFEFGRAEPDGAAGQTISYAVMELLEGETVRARLTRGPVPPRKAVDFSIQIANGLAAAHGKGLVHRDLKPDNLWITPDDRVKILDFGLAKPIVAASDLTVAGVTTNAGLVMGTVGYMAPEQARGQMVDHRSDIFAFGAVLYEMLSGRRAFTGDSPADTISAILNSDPPEITISDGAAPAALDRIVRRCLEKKPELRFQSAQDLAFALDTLSTRSSGATATAAAAAAPPAGPTVRRPAPLPWAVAAAALLVGAVGWTMALRRPAVEPPWQLFTAITDAAGVETTPSLSPDGTTVAYASRASGSWDVYVQHTAGRRPVAIAASPEYDESAPAFSPDGRRIAFHRAGGTSAIFVANVTGEAARRVSSFGAHPAWSPDGRQIAFTTEEIVDPYMRFGDSSLWTVDAEGGEPRQVDGAGDAAQAAWSPSGARIAYWSNSGGQRDIYTVPATGGTRVAVTSDAPLDWSPVWSPDGRFIYFASDRGGSMNLWRIPIDEGSGEPRGLPEPVTTGVQAAAEMPSLSADGTRLAFRSRVTAANPVVIPFDPISFRAGTPVVLNNSNTSRRPSSVSRDGRWLALANLGEPQEDIFVSALDGSGMRRITDDVARDRLPVWSPDGQTLYFYSNRSGIWEIWAVDIEGGGLRRVAGRKEGVLYPLVSPDGTALISSGAAGSFGVFLSSLKPGVSPDDNTEPLDGTLDGFFATSWSPDGTKIVGYFATRSNTPSEMGVYDLRARRLLRRFDVPSSYPVWLPDNRHVCYFSLGGGSLHVLDTDTGRTTSVDVRLPLPDGGDAFAISPDGRGIFYSGRRQEADIWIVERGK